MPRSSSPAPAPAAPSSTLGRMHIGELAERAGLSLRTLRHYDAIGLLRPSGRSDGGFRLYSERDLTRLQMIRRLKPLDFSLEDLTRFLDAQDRLASNPQDAAARVVSREFIHEARRRHERLTEQLAVARDQLVELESSDASAS